MYCPAARRPAPSPPRPAQLPGPTGDYAGWWVTSEEYKLRYTFYGNNKQQAITASVRGGRGRDEGGRGERVGGRCSTSGVRGNTALIHMGECLVTHKNTFKFWPRALHCIHMKLSLFSCNAVRNMNHHEPMGEVHRYLFRSHSKKREKKTNRSDCGMKQRRILFVLQKQNKIAVVVPGAGTKPCS